MHKQSGKEESQSLLLSLQIFSSYFAYSSLHKSDVFQIFKNL